MLYVFSVSDDAKDIFYYAGLGDEAKIASLLSNNAKLSVNSQDDAGRTYEDSFLMPL